MKSAVFSHPDESYRVQASPVADSPLSELDDVFIVLQVRQPEARCILSVFHLNPLFDHVFAIAGWSSRATSFLDVLELFVLAPNVPLAR